MDHDFPIPELDKVTPLGVYAVNRNAGFVNLGISKDTPEFAVESVSRWWLTIGKNTYPQASKRYINGDVGGSNGYQNRLFKSNSSCKHWQTKADLLSMYRTSPREPASGTKLNTGCFAISAATGKASR